MDALARYSRSSRQADVPACPADSAHDGSRHVRAARSYDAAASTAFPPAKVASQQWNTLDRPTDSQSPDRALHSYGIVTAPTADKSGTAAMKRIRPPLPQFPRQACIPACSPSRAHDRSRHDRAPRSYGIATAPAFAAGERSISAMKRVQPTAPRAVSSTSVHTGMFGGQNLWWKPLQPRL